ncbi:MAG: hypothetical protein OXC01_14190 [Immundisolibacterales bacterium]|nr:hypothetical protein [Immundisolibacterales bacterium]
MSTNSQRMAAELVELSYRPEPFTAPKDQGGAEGVRFEYRIEDGSRAGESVTLAVAVHENEGEWPEVAPHWLYLSPPDAVLEQQVRGSRPAGAVTHYECAEGQAWLGISAPPSDFWDQIETPGGKCMSTYLNRHVRRIWSTR